MILTGKLFKHIYSVGGSVKPPVIVHAADMTAADAGVMLFASQQPGYAGEEVQILAATEIDLETL
jgi:hypothetical protein